MAAAPVSRYRTQPLSIGPARQVLLVWLPCTQLDSLLTNFLYCQSVSATPSADSAMFPIQRSVADQEAPKSFHEKAGLYQELNFMCTSARKHPAVTASRRVAWTGGCDPYNQRRRKWQLPARRLRNFFVVCKITASVAILPSALSNEPFGLHASWAFSFQWVLSICISTSISPDAQ